MSWRELRTFIRQIPPDSAYVRAVRLVEGDDPDWDTAAYLLARVANEVTSANYQRAGKKTPKNALIGEPGKATKRKARVAANGDRPGTWQDLDNLY